MNKKIRYSVCAALAGMAALSLAACNPQPAATTSSEEPPLKGAKIGGDFTLTNQDGGQTSFSDFAGKYRIVYFGYTYCPDVCPTDLQTVSLGLKQFEKEHPRRGSEIQPIFITIDPVRDTPGVLKQWVSGFHPRMIGLTGSEDQIKNVAAQYLILYEKEKANSQGAYLVNHSRQAYLFGRNGEPLALLPYDGTPAEVAREIDRWTK